MDKVEKHTHICTRLITIYEQKNKDYGDSFGQQFKEYGLTSSAIRLEDKFRRFKNLIKNPAQVKDETLEDTLMDMANYCIMTIIELQSEEPKRILI
ncbi:nucleotide modification associated domain-containing protein [Bacillus litorisediminis]|uniref:nucleotide modification associated domain-containing protein n=1 Tax=Bacillus litorisediminis TaxID=2922713 RepID=UPI001FACF4BB|nr:nucleotide modification associated domain-containing protein [Bacillus litorisediminis]